MKTRTNIHCNGCQHLDISKRSFKRTKNNYWVLFCKKLDMHIDTIKIANQDLNNANMPEIESPFDCPKRQELRKQNKECKFIKQI